MPDNKLRGMFPDGTLTGFVGLVWPEAMESELLWESLAGEGSDRIFMRVSAGDKSAVVVYGPDPAENRSYELIGRHLYEKGGWTPEILAVDHSLGLFLMEDLGDFQLWDWVRAAGYEARDGMYDEVIGVMVDLHVKGADGFDPDWCCQTPEYDRSLIREREADYFLSAFVNGLMGLGVSPDHLAGEFEELAAAALQGTEKVLIHRDFQSRNVMIAAGAPRLVDYQGARLGPPGYDLASLTYDPYVKLRSDLKDRLVEEYCWRREEAGDFDREAFLRTFPLLAVCRLMQALGAYGFLTSVKGKFLFEKYIPAAAGTLDDLLRRPEFDFAPRLRELTASIRRTSGGL